MAPCFIDGCDETFGFRGPVFDQTPDAGGTHFALEPALVLRPFIWPRSVNNDHTGKGLNLVMIMDPATLPGYRLNIIITAALT